MGVKSIYGIEKWSNLVESKFSYNVIISSQSTEMLKSGRYLRPIIVMLLIFFNLSIRLLLLDVE